MQVGERVLYERRRRHLSQMELAQRSGLGQQHVSKIEKGHLRPRRGTLQKLVKALGMKVDDFYGSLEEVLRPEELEKVRHHRPPLGHVGSDRKSKRQRTLEGTVNEILAEVERIPSPRRLGGARAVLEITREIAKALCNGRVN